MKFSSAAAVIFLSLIAWTSAATAETRRSAESSVPPPMFQKMIDCRVLTDPTARLACYDREVGSVATAQQSRDLIVIDREQVRNTRRALFGLTLPRLDIFGRGNDADHEEQEFTELDTTISSASQRNGHWTIVVEDGARWLQTDTRELVREPRSGMPIKIRRAAMGSFFANVGGQTAIRVQRQN